MRYGVLAMVMLVGMLLLGAVWAAAQDATQVSSAACAPVAEAIWTAASNACISGPVGYICNGGAGPQAEPAGAVSNALNPVGALVDVKDVTGIHTPAVVSDSVSGGLVWLRSPQPLQYTGLMVGDVRLSDATAPGYPAWQSVIVQTSQDTPTCGAVPRSAYVVQTPLDQPVNIAINGASLTLNGTVLVQTAGDTTLFAGLSGQSSIFAVAQDQLLRPGQQIVVNYSGSNFASPISAPGQPVPLDESMVQGFPVALLDRPIILPQPGYVATDGAVNLRTAPSINAAVIVQVPGGQVLSVLGRNPGGDWYHVRLDSGETGWMYAQLLLQNVGTIQAIYEATPLPPQRYGDLGKIATILAPAGVNLRQAPDVMFPIVMTIPDKAAVTLLARSPYSPWVKVDYNGVVGWVALITIDTEAVIDALPIDYNVPPPPAPTRVPGSFGNAYPDPNKGG
jgi:uncharacterized protein YgiM (DUF1202 family)